MSMEIFEVQSAALAPGVYNCYKQKLLEAGWGPGSGDKFDDFDITVVEVLNVIENDTLVDYTRMLAAGDRIAAWQFKDGVGITHWVGIPVVPSVRRAKTTEPAAGSSNITCNLYANDGETEIDSGLGSGIEVYCHVTMNADLNEAVPRLATGDDIFVQNIAGKWWCTTVFQSSEDCVCS